MEGEQSHCQNNHCQRSQLRHKAQFLLIGQVGFPSDDCKDEPVNNSLSLAILSDLPIPGCPNIRTTGGWNMIRRITSWWRQGPSPKFCWRRVITEVINFKRAIFWL